MNNLRIIYFYTLFIFWNLFKIISKYDLQVFKVQNLAVHGGSTRYFIKRKSSKIKIEKGRIFRDFVWEEFRAFVKFQIKKTNNETNKLFFSSKGKHIEVGNFLNQEQKEDLIKEIRSAISFLNDLDP